MDDKDKSLWIWDPQTDKSTKFANKVSTYQWSPTGDKIAYFAENGIFVMDLRSKEVVLLGGGYYETYTWSPDGIQLVFSEGCKVHLIDSNGANKRLLYDLNEGGSGGGGEISKDLIDEYLRGQRQFWTRGPIAYWSDDGTKIAIVLAIGRCRNHVLSINANGSSAKTCSYIMDCKALLPKSSTIDPYLGYSSSSPVFIKNEDGALFQYKYDGLSIAEDAGGWPQPDIWVLDVRKRGTIMYNWGFHNNIWITTTIGTEKRITSQPTFKNQGMITKDGKWIVFTETTVKNGRLDSVGGAFDADLTVNIIAMNIETGFTKKINAQSNAVNPAWQFPARSIK